MTLDVIRKLYALHEKDGCIASSHEMWGMVGECLAEIDRLENITANQSNDKQEITYHMVTHFGKLRAKFIGDRLSLFEVIK